MVALFLLHVVFADVVRDYWQSAAPHFAHLDYDHLAKLTNAPQTNLSGEAALIQRWKSVWLNRWPRGDPGYPRLGAKRERRTVLQGAEPLAGRGRVVRALLLRPLLQGRCEGGSLPAIRRAQMTASLRRHMQEGMPTSICGVSRRGGV